MSLLDRSVASGIVDGYSRDGMPSAASLVGTTLLFEVITTGSATGWNWVLLTPSQVAAIASSTSLWMLGKSNSATTDPGYTSTATTTGFDFTVQNMLIFSGIAANPSTAYPASLAGEPSTTSAVFPFFAVLYRPAAGTGDVTIYRTGVHTDDVLGGSESDLTAPDPAGANVMAFMTAPAFTGLQLHGMRIAVGATHSQQFRIGVATGGVFENIDGATLVWDAGQTTGSSTNTWLSAVAPTGGASVSIASGANMWAWFRGNGGITVRYAPNADATTANPNYDPMDFPISSGLGDGAEYETNSGNPNHSTSDAVALESTLVRDVADDLLPGNYPGIAIDVRIPADTMAVV